MINKIHFHNNFNSIGLKDFKEIELNIFFLIVRKLHNQQSNLVKINFKELKKEVALEYKKNYQLEVMLDSIFDKLQRLRIKEVSKDKKHYKRIILFQTFIADLKKKELQIKVNEDALYFFNNLSKCFTSIDFEVYKELNSKYSKELYRRLRQFHKTGVWKVFVEDFKEMLDVPEHYTAKYINNYILKKSFSELLEIYPTLSVDYIYEENPSRGRPKIKTLIFKFPKYVIHDGKRVDPETGAFIDEEEIYEDDNINIDSLSLEQKNILLKQLLNEQRLNNIKDDNFEPLLDESEHLKRKSPLKVSWANENVYSIMNKTFSTP